MLNYQLFERILPMSEGRLFSYLTKSLRDFGYNPTIVPTKYIYAPKVGANVLLVAHLDTVVKSTVQFKVKTVNHKREYHSKGTTAIGADDRSGVFTILEYLRLHGDNVSILFTCGEEIGGVGISQFVRDKIDLSHIKLAIEIDKAGLPNVACVYDDMDQVLSDYLEGQGYELIYGSYTDICDLQDVGISSVNISANYYRQHTSQEYCILDDIYTTIDLMASTISDLVTNPITFKTDIKKYTFARDIGYHGSWSVTPKCAICNSSYQVIKTISGVHVCHYCIDDLVSDYVYNAIDTPIDATSHGGFCDNCQDFSDKIVNKNGYDVCPRCVDYV